MTHDKGSTPNPFWGLCTLAICKPGIRKSAKIGDWIVGTGSKGNGFENKLVFAMKVTDIQTFKQYDSFCKNSLPDKIPDKKNKDARLHVGDCIYSFDGDLVSKRPGPHNETHIEHDLSGRNVLLSDHFYYFGSQPAPLPTPLLHMVRQGQGYRSKINAPYVAAFVEWIESFEKDRNKVLAMPLHFSDNSYRHCSPETYTCGKATISKQGNC